MFDATNTKQLQADRKQRRGGRSQGKRQKDAEFTGDEARKAGQRQAGTSTGSQSCAGESCMRGKEHSWWVRLRGLNTGLIEDEMQLGAQVS